MTSIIHASDARTLPGLLQERVRRTPDVRAYLAYHRQARSWRGISWRQVGERTGVFRRALQALDLKKGDRVALVVPNGTDWVCFDMAALGLGLVVVPLYLRDSAFNHAFILRHSGARMALVDSVERWAALCAADAPAPAVEHVWVSDGAGAAAPLRPLADVLSAAAAGPSPEIKAGPDDLATLIYTSGTTDRPKAVMLSHAAILWNAQGVTNFIAPSQDDVFLSVLPLAHAFERTVGCYLPMMAGATVAHARSIEMLPEDFKAVRPSVFLAVPRLYERAYAAVHQRVERSRVARSLLGITARAGWRRFQWKHGRGPAPDVPSRLAWPLLRRLVARPILMTFGGRVRVAVSGGAPLPGEVARFLIGVGLPLVEGYGLTEAAPVVTGTSLEDNLPGSVGRPLSVAEVRLSEVGELLVRSPSVMQGYWRDPEATAAAFDAEGWLRTGDLAEIRDGRVFIRGRLTQIIALATGEHINPDPMEAAILRDPLIEQACVLGEGMPYAVAILVLNGARWRAAAKAWSVDIRRPNAAAAKREVLRRVAAQLQTMPAAAQVRDVHLVLEPWTTASGLLTPTLKVRRHAVRTRHADDIAALYRAHAVFN